MPAITQNFSMPAGDVAEINFDVDPDDVGISLLGSTPYWFVYAQNSGVPTGSPLIKKVLDHGLQITNPDELKFQVLLDFADTSSLLGNYYHKAVVVLADESHVTTTVGIMTITEKGDDDFTVEELP